MNLDPNRLARFVDDIERSLARLERLGQMDAEHFLADQDAQDIARSRLLTAIEAALSICFHIAARGLNRVPTEYAQCFSLLAEAGMLDQALAARLISMVRFRNRLIHVYWDTDYSQVHRMIRQDLEDLRAFVRAVGGLE
jgi:uncharacterized protein YutE (UPF0331/DUF86 family)